MAVIVTTKEQDVLKLIIHLMYSILWKDGQFDC